MDFKAIERVVSVSHVSAINWVKKYGKALSHASEREKKLSAVALDELCSYAGSKKKIWIWLAVDSVGKRVLYLP
jgi:transposase-like protein